MISQSNKDIRRKMINTNKKPQKGVIRVLVIENDYPLEILKLDCRCSWDTMVLEYLESRYVVCQFKDRDSYKKGKRLVGQHRKLVQSGVRDKRGEHIGIQIGKFQGLVELLFYQQLPLSKSAKKTIRQEHRHRNYSVAKLANDWDVSESHIRQILKKEKPSVWASGDPIKQGFSEGQPPVPCRVVAGRGGYDQ